MNADRTIGEWIDCAADDYDRGYVESAAAAALIAIGISFAGSCDEDIPAGPIPYDVGDHRAANRHRH